MATTSSRLLSLLSLLGARPNRSGRDLADRLGISTRTLRRDVESLRELGYPVQALKGPDGGYRLGAGGRLPPLLLDDEQAVAVAVALQTAPASVAGIDDAAARALTSIRQVMPARLRAEVDAMHLTAIGNSWEFPAPPIAPDTLKAVGYAVRNGHLLRFDYLTPDSLRLHPNDPGFTPPLRVEPHHLVMWAGRWYLVAYTPATEAWGIYRVDRIHAHAPTGTPFQRRELSEPDVARYVMTSHDRGDTPARWPCLGTVLMELPPDVVARWAPGGSVIEYVAPTQTRITLGAWSWAGVAGLLATFDADITIIEPGELRDACRTLARRYRQAGE
ncbi:helix-turn-helix transcriptional regulator [Spirillospora sp. NBC_01491]|uniref:helix-turn-helix transcriptional regulator n=1 Tax=Spirillospora sp. NBC_01491 TaxID=2976007 RepID=UPI002E2F8AC1|nr:WYL domain-containing protein [Spirillospora sp. NBC_01491]